MAILIAENLKKRFAQTQALDGVSFEVEPGEIFGLIGPDGAGKTTILRLLVGVLETDEGRSVVGGKDVKDDAEAVQEQVGYMPQHFSLYGDLTVEENIRFFADMFFVPRDKRQERLAELYAFSRLEPFADRPAAKLSGGMQKKLALSCNMIHTPKALLLDEPTTGVDPVSRRELWDILYRFARSGIAIVVCTPYMDEAERCHRVGLIHEGRFLDVDSPQNIIEKHNEQVFEITGTDLRKAREVLSKVGWLADAYPFGDALHVAAVERPNLESDILGVLTKADLQGSRLTRVQPTFEDVFMGKIREAGS